MVAADASWEFFIPKFPCHNYASSSVFLHTQLFNKSSILKLRTELSEVKWGESVERCREHCVARAKGLAKLFDEHTGNRI